MTGEFQHRSLPMLLLQAREAALAVFRPILKQFSLTEQQWRIIRVLNDHPTGEMEAGQIAKECFILSPSLTGVLERMERDGLVQRMRPAYDQRKVMVSLSPQCKTLVERISPLIEAQYCSIEQQIGIPRLNQLCQELDDLVAGLAPADHVTSRPRGGEASFTVVRPGDGVDADADGELLR
jgi:homoprotocatechuate degradation regulator HpaR